jgi:hypothetical protein
MRVKSLVAGALGCALLAGLLVAPMVATAERTPSGPTTGTPLIQRVRGSTDEGGTFRGTFEIRRFLERRGDIYAAGLLDGRIKDSEDNLIGRVSDHRTLLPLTGTAGSCQILHLELGPVDLDLLGLVVHLDKVVLDITAEAGPGNLLGNLLCAIAHLLDPAVPQNVLVTLLNYLITLLS